MPTLLWAVLVAKANSLQSLSRREQTVLKDLYERVDEDYLSYPEVKYFQDELNECEQSLMVALNDLDTSQRRVEQLESPYEAWTGQGSVTTKWLKN